jgi:sortase A
MASTGYKKRFWLFIVIRTLANSLIIGGVILALVSFWPFIGAELKYWWDNFRGQQYVLAGDTLPENKRGGFGNLVAAPPPIEVVPKSTDFGIIIEKIDVNSPVVPRVDSGNYNEYIAALAEGVAHADGTALPGSKDQANNNVFLFAHSAINPIEARRYNSVFYLLRKLDKGDRIVTFYKGRRYDYIVFDKRVVQATDVRYLTDISKEPILTLQTCDPPGSSLRRLIVTAKLDKSRDQAQKTN